MKKQIAAIVIAVWLVVSLACASGTPAQKVGQVELKTNEPATVGAATKEEKPAPTETEAAAVTPATPTVFAVGDVVEAEDHRITLVSAAYNNGLLRTDILIENTSKEDIAVSSLMSFSAKDSEGTKLEQEYIDCGNSLDGKILAGDRLRGNLCWKLSAPTQLKIYYEPGLLSNVTVVWALDAAQLPTQLADAPVSPSTETGEMQTHKVGETVALDEQSITLNSASVNSNILKANFTVENTGTKEIAVSSMLLFTAKSSDGVKLDQEYFDCGTSMDGKVLPGDKLKGDICWKVANATDIKVYYEGQLFGSTTVVWSVE